MSKDLFIALRVSLLTLFLTGLAYPFLVTEFAYIISEKNAEGSVLYNEQNKRIGSELIGQSFKNPAYFFSRPSVAGKGYDGMASQGSNLGPTSQKLMMRIQERVKNIEKSYSKSIPTDLVTTSASGLDPHISLEAAYWQASRIALERNVSLERILTIIDNLVEYPQLFFMGQARINVLKLNLVLDQFFGPPGNL